MKAGPIADGYAKWKSSAERIYEINPSAAEPPPRCHAIGLALSDVDPRHGIIDAALDAKRYDVAGRKPARRRMAEPDWAAINRELKRKHVTLQILWDEYIAGEPDGYRYNRFCALYRKWEAKLPVTM